MTATTSGEAGRARTRHDPRQRIDGSLAALRAWLEQRGFAGIEPHDALTSPLIRRTPLGRVPLIRLAALQGLRRFPFNPRPLLGIAPARNPVTLGWALSAYCALDDERIAPCIDQVLAWLKQTEVSGYSGACWGYYFDWQTRSGYKRGNLPLIVPTAFIGFGLLDVYARLRREECLAWARSACEFILRDLNRSVYPGGFVFSYSPEDHEQVYNASMLGATLLARVGAITGESRLVEMSRLATDMVVAGQLPDGAWPYARGDHRTFVDNFHSGYVLCGLKDTMEALGDSTHEAALVRGWEFYRSSFFVDGCIPKYYHDRLYPVDAHAAAQSIVTLVEFGDLATAVAVAQWAIEHLQAHDGGFHYQMHRHWINRTRYLRWSSGWMFTALARLRRALRAQAAGGQL